MKRSPLTASAVAAALLAACFLGGRLGAEEDLPASLKKELTKITQQIDKLDQRVGRVEFAQIEQGVREVEQWIEEFSIDAELFDNDPMLASLSDRLRKVAASAREAVKKKAGDAMAKGDEKKEPTGPRMLDVKVPVDLKNVSFKKDVAPIIVNVCGGCHGKTGRNVKEFDASTFASFVSQIDPGKPDDSHVLNLVTGKAEPRMPRGGMARFDKEWADTWRAWIEQGAKFDGTTRDAPMTAYYIDLETQKREVLAKLSTPELEKMHRDHADRQMEIVAPK
ncbi:MAG: hypothetical protein ACRDD1_15335, partial [Planctomycetia bacterium]